MLKSRIITMVFVLMFTMSAVALASDDAVDTIAADYALSKADVQAACDAGVSFADINQLAFIAMATNKDFNDVRKYKDIGGTWAQTASLAGITEWHIQHGQHQLIANQLYNIFRAPKEDTLSLLTQRYHPKAIAIIAAIAQLGTADMELIAAKKHGKSWYEVAKQIGVSASQIDQCMSKVNRAFNDRAVFHDYYGRYGQTYGYHDSDYNSGGYDIEFVKFSY